MYYIVAFFTKDMFIFYRDSNFNRDGNASVKKR